MGQNNRWRYDVVILDVAIVELSQSTETKRAYVWSMLR